MELKEWSPGEKFKNVVRTDKYWIEYSNGERHLDIHSGNAAYILGYNDEEVLDAMRQEPVNFVRDNYGESSLSNEKLINFICKRGNWSGLAWAVSGSDAVESAIAMNDIYWKNINPNKIKIISFSSGYHGTTMLAKHLRGEYSYFNRASIIESPNNINFEQQLILENAALNEIRYRMETDPQIGSIIIEPIPIIGNLTTYSQNWWQSIRSLCDEFKILMIVDDVAVCWGKNGTFFGWESYGIQPDISSLGKSLTGGYSPLSAAVCNKKVFDVLKLSSWMHSHTWCPNMQGVAASLIVSKKIEILLDRIPYINKQICKISNELELSITGKNLFLSLNTSKNMTMADLSKAKLASTIWNPSIENKSIKIFPPIIADEEYFETLKIRLKTLL